MSNLLSQLLPASFKGASFYCEESSVESGRKQVTHEFPNSDRRYVEDLGKLLPTYKIKAIIGGANYTQAKNALQSALEQGGVGLLIHPFFGNLNVVAKPYTLTETIGTLGEAKFDLTFEVAEANIYPTGSLTNLSNIFSIADSGLSSLTSDINKLFSLKNLFPNNFADAQNLLNAVGNAFGVNTQSFTQDISAINQFSSTLKNFYNNINQTLSSVNSNQAQTVASAPVVSNVTTTSATLPTLGEQTMGLFNATDTLSDNPSNLFVIYQKFFIFNNNQKPIPKTTFQRIQRQNNRDVINGAIRAGSLIQAYRAAAQIDYQNINQLNQINNILETQYKTINNAINVTNTSKAAIASVRNAVRNYLESDALNINQISEVTTNTQPLRTLVYQYYGSTRNLSQIADLNRIKENNFVSGNVSILTS